MNKDLIILVTGRVMQIVIMLVSVRLLTSFLTPEEVGNYYIILAYLAFFNLVLLNPFGMYFTRHLLHWQKNHNLLNALFVFIIWIILVSIISIPISIVLHGWLGYESKFGLAFFVVYIAVAIFISTTHRNVIGGTNTLGYRKEFVVYLISTLLLGLFFSVGIVYFYYHHALGWLYGIIISETMMLVPIVKFFIQNNRLSTQKIKQRLSKEKIKTILLFSLPIGLTTFLFWGQTIAYRFIIDYKYSTEVLGFIAVGLGVSSAVFSAIESISMQYFNPIFLKKILDASKAERSQAWNEIARQIVPIYILTAFFTIAMSEVLVKILIDHKFHGAYIYTMVGVGFEFFRVMTALFYIVSQSEYKTSLTM
jgi:O-antigen/teichoic acid export membrane protein